MSLREVPHNVEAEQRVLGSLLQDNAAMHDVALILGAGDFFRESHAAWFRAMKARYDAGARWDVLTLAETMPAGEYAAAGGDDGLAEILAATPHPYGAVEAAHYVRQHAIRRDVIAACQQTISDARDRHRPAAEVLRTAEERIFGIADREATGDTRPLPSLIGHVLERIHGRNEGVYSGMPSGFRDLDGVTDGFAPGQFVILAARPSMGKTALALDIARHAVFDGIGVLFVSLEMTALDLSERLLVAVSGVDGHRVRTGQGLGTREMEALGDAFGQLRRCASLWIDDTPIRDVSQIAANARRHKAAHDIGLVVVDYLQLIDPGADVARRASRQEQVSAISRRLKALPREIGVPVVVLSQLNRQSESRDTHRPRMSDLRESGAIEQDADLVLLLHRPEYFDPNDQPGIAELIVAKNRNGRTGTVRLRFTRHLARFEDIDSSASINPGDF